jgi:hypothetical protein
MKWTEGEEELKCYSDGAHVCANYLDETETYMIDWLRNHLYWMLGTWFPGIFYRSCYIMEVWLPRFW